MSVVRFIEMDSILSELYDRLGRMDIKRSTVKNYSQEIAKKFTKKQNKVHKIAKGVVDNYTYNMPKDLSSIVQIAFSISETVKIKREDIVQWTQKVMDGSGCELEINLICPKCHETACSCGGTEVILDIDDLWRRSHPEHQYGHLKWLHSYAGTHKDQPISNYHPSCVIARANTSDFFGANLHIPGCVNLDDKLCASSPVEYLINDPKIQFNKKEGEIIIAYKAVKTDSEGFYMLPDVPYMYDVIKWFVISEVMHTKYLQDTKNRGNFTAYKDAQTEYRRYAGSLTEVLDTPSPAEWFEFTKENYFKMVKNMKTAEYYKNKTPDYWEHHMRRLVNHN